MAETEAAECVKVHGSPGTGLARGKLESHSGNLVHPVILYKELPTRSVCVQFTVLSCSLHCNSCSLGKIIVKNRTPGHMRALHNGLCQRSMHRACYYFSAGGKFCSVLNFT